MGVTFTTKTDFNQHVDNRITKCKNSSYSLSDIGMCYPGVMSNTKSYLFHSICQSTLLYCLGVVNININMMKHFNENTQSSIMKRLKSMCYS